MDRPTAALFTIHAWPPSPGGAEQQCRFTAQALCRRGWSVEAMAPGRRTAREDDGPVRLRRVRAPRAGPLRRPGQALAGLRGLRALTTPPQAVHLYCLSPFNLGVMAAARARGLATLVRVSTWDEIDKVRAGPGGSAMWRVFRAADRWLVPTEDLAAQVCDQDVERDRITILPNAVWPAPPELPRQDERQGARRRLGLGGGPVALLLGRLSPEKRPLTVLEAWARVAHPSGATLLVVGDGPLRDSTARRASRPDLAGSVRLLPWQEDPTPCFLAADLLVSASLREAFPNVVAEAMAFGLPVATPATGFVPEWVRDGEHALVLERADPEELTAAIRRLFADRELGARLGGRARREVLARYAPGPILDRLVEIHRETAAARSRPGRRLRPAPR